MTSNAQEKPFEGFDYPNTTPVPDIIFDELLEKLTGNELKVLLYIVRRTYGFNKNADAISLSQFRKGITTQEGKTLDKGCGIGHNRTILVALASLEKRGYVVSKKGKTKLGDDDTTIYKLHFKKSDKSNAEAHSDGGVVTPSNEGSLPEVTTVVTPRNEGSYLTLLPVVTSGNTQETVLQDTVKQETVLQQEEKPAEENSKESTVSPTPEKQTSSSKRKPDKPKPDATLQVRINEVYETFDKLLQEVSNDPETRYSRTKTTTEAIKEFLNCKPTSEKLRQVYFDLWNSPPGQNGFSWRDNMSIAAICRNYDKRLLALRGKQQKAEQSTVTGEERITLKAGEPRQKIRSLVSRR